MVRDRYANDVLLLSWRVRQNRSHRWFINKVGVYHYSTSTDVGMVPFVESSCELESSVGNYSQK